jgi:hypothetical protein
MELVDSDIADEGVGTELLEEAELLEETELLEEEVVVVGVIQWWLR